MNEKNFIFQTAGEYQELLRNPVNNAMEIAVHESQLTWLVYIIGAAIGGRMTFTANDEHDILDGDLVVRVCALLRFALVRKCSDHVFSIFRSGSSIDEFNGLSFTTNWL